MGRPERPLDPAAGPAQAFANELRSSREAAGRPKYSTLAQRTGRSQTALSEAAGGQRLPSWETVEAFVRGCGDDPAAWRARWEAAARRHVDAVEPAVPPETPRAQKTSGRRRQVVGLLTVVVLLLLGAASWLVWPDREETELPSPPATPVVSVADGADPMDTRCSEDPQVSTVDSVEVTQDRTPVGRVELRYAPRCGASWPRFSAFTATALERGVVIHVHALRLADNKRTTFQAPFVGAPVFGNMLRSTEGSTRPASTPCRFHCVATDRRRRHRTPAWTKTVRSKRTDYLLPASVTPAGRNCGLAVHPPEQQRRSSGGAPSTHRRRRPAGDVAGAGTRRRRTDRRLPRAGPGGAGGSRRAPAARQA